MSEELENLLLTIPDNPPVGDVLMLIDELERKVKAREDEKVIDGKPVITRIEPNWSELKRAAAAVLETKSKHLRAAVIFCLASVSIRPPQWAGLRDGLALIAGLLERFWDKGQPPLEPKDKNDKNENAQVRVNIINDLALPINTYLDPYNFVLRVQKIPLTDSVGHGAWSYAAIQAARFPGESLLGPDVQPPSADEVTAAWKDTDPAKLSTSLEDVKAAQASLERIVKVFKDKASPKTQPSLGLLKTTLGRIHDTLLAQGTASQATDEPKPMPDTKSDKRPTSNPEPDALDLKALPAQKLKRKKALEMLAAVRAYFEEVEPSSPVPLLIELALDISRRNFVDILKRLPPESVDQLDKIFRQENPSSDTAKNEKSTVEESGGQKQRK